MDNASSAEEGSAGHEKDDPSTTIKWFKYGGAK